MHVICCVFSYLFPMHSRKLVIILRTISYLAIFNQVYNQSLYYYVVFKPNSNRLLNAPQSVSLEDCQHHKALANSPAACRPDPDVDGNLNWPCSQNCCHTRTSSRQRNQFLCPWRMRCLLCHNLSRMFYNKMGQQSFSSHDLTMSKMSYSLIEL